MNKILKYILMSFIAAVIAGCMVASYIAGVQSRRPIVCKGVRIEILDSAENSFVSVADVRKFIDRSYGKIIGEPLDSLDLVKIEHIVDSRSAVRKSQAFVTRDSILRINVTQRKPIVRFQRQDGGFYADEDGYIFPLQSSYASHVQVIDGSIPLAANSGYKGAIEDKTEKEWFGRMMDIVNFIEKSSTWQDKIVQISVADDGELTLVPREGKERFLFGQPVEIQKKFKKMEMYYTHIVPRKGAGTYSSVDVRFDGQVVCR